MATNESLPIAVAKVASLQRGDIIQHRHSGVSYVVDANYGTHATAIRTIQIDNPDEWLVFQRARSTGA